jgi:predicted Rossmann-fold nucleotide-binding protein
MTIEILKQGHRAGAVRRRRVVAVFGSRGKVDVGLCREVGRLVAELGCDLLTGSGRGVMEEASKAFCLARDELGAPGLAIGIVPGKAQADGSYETKPGYPSPWVELAIYTHLPVSGVDGKDQRSRNHINVLSADAIVALPGGSGTQSEVELALRYGVPAIAYGGPGFSGVPRAASVDEVRGFLQAQLDQL